MASGGITKKDLAVWMNDPVTREVFNYLIKKREETVNRMLNLNVETMGMETYAMQSLALRYIAEGLSESIDLYNFERFVCQEDK